jgi:peptidoglycan-N-acetylmuramic acid deacetylase
MHKKIISLCLLASISLCSYSSKADSMNNSISTITIAKSSYNLINKLEKPQNNDNKRNSSIDIKNLDTSKLDKTEKNWFFQPKKDGTPAGEPQDILNLINKYSTYYLGDTSKKVLYLTFDEGYENGYTSKILDILKANNVKAAFFVTTPYINANKDLIERMAAEGHLVCNHSTHHPSMAAAALKGADSFEKEFTITEKAYEDVTGMKMPKFFRPPMGKYSELSLFYTQKLGYKTIFWSFAYHDWDTKDQPSLEHGKKMIMERTHNGAIVLLHAVSKTNTEILDSVIKEWKDKGYELENLDKLP